MGQREREVDSESYLKFVSLAENLSYAYNKIACEEQEDEKKDG